MGAEFNRGHGLHAAIQGAVDHSKLSLSSASFRTSSNPLLFFCDVDIVFTELFVHRCRSNAIHTRRVYFPTAFS
jgi:hypothetical protein